MAWIGQVSLPWRWILLVLWTAMLGASFLNDLAPASQWLEVRSVRVSDTAEGVPPHMKVDRTIHRPFRAKWLTDIEMRLPSGRWLVLCTSQGANNYSPENDLPDPLTLDWWTFPVRCTPDGPGRYRVETTWLLEIPGGLTKEVRAVSNEFRVTPGDSPDRSTPAR